MTNEHHAWLELHWHDAVEHPRPETCACGQELDCCTRQHCPRCGALLPHRAA